MKLFVKQNKKDVDIDYKHSVVSYDSLYLTRFYTLDCIHSYDHVSYDSLHLTAPSRGSPISIIQWQAKYFTTSIIHYQHDLLTVSLCPHMWSAASTAERLVCLSSSKSSYKLNQGHHNSLLIHSLRPQTFRTILPLSSV